MTSAFEHHRSPSRRPRPSVPSPGLLASIVADCVRARREQGRPVLAATLDVSVHHEQALVADPTLVRRVLEPLIRRAMESATQAPDRGESPVVREVVVTSIDLGGAIEIEVADSGPSLPDRVRTWLNETTDSQQAPSNAPDGTGLALAAIRAAAARIDGTLTAANCPEGGVAITLRLPRRQAQRLAA